jgi:hypothetical protein
MNQDKMRFQNIAFLSNMLSITLTSIALPLVIILYFILKNADFTYIQSIGFNWKSYPITSLSTIDVRNPICKNDHTQLIFDFWFGTSNGCDCTNSLFVVGSALTRGFCTRRQPGPGCIDISSNDPSPYVFWRKNLFCKNKSTLNYLDMNIVNDPNVCGEKFKSCGIIDSFGNYLCLPESENCPINKIEFIKNEDLLKNSNKNNINNTNNTNNTNNNINSNLSIDYDNNLLLKNFDGYLKIDGGVWAFSNKFTNSKIINQFKISEGKPCLNTYFHNSYKGRFILENNYYLNTCWKTKVDKSIQFDERYILLDSYEKKKLYDENRITGKFSYFLNKTFLYNDRPDFGEGVFRYPAFYKQRSLQENNNNNQTTPSIEKYYANYLYNYDFNFNYNIDLYARNYIGLSLKCFNDIKRNNLKDELFAYLKNAPIYLAIASDLMYFVFLAVFGIQVYNFVVYGTFHCIKKTVDQKDATIYFDMFKWKVVICLFPLLLTLLLIVIHIYIIGLLKTPNNILAILGDKNCVDNDTFGQLDDFFTRKKNANTLIIISISNLVIELLNILGFNALRLLKVIKDE